MILCCGEALIDMVPSGDCFKPCPGGSPFNTAIAIGRLGTPVAFIGRISNDFFGQSLMDKLAESGVRTDLVARSDQTSTLAFVKLEKGEARYAFYTEGSADRSFSPADLPQTLPSEISCIAFGSISMTMEPVASTIESLIKREGSSRVVSFDPNIRPAMIRDRDAYARRFASWLERADIVKISSADLDFIYPGLPLHEAAERILSYGPALTVLTLGKNGARAVGRRGGGSKLSGTIFSAETPAAEVAVVDTIGAGDTFHAAFLSWLEDHGRMTRAAVSALSERELEDALAYANLASALTCTKRGAQPPTHAELAAAEKKPK